MLSVDGQKIFFAYDGIKLWVEPWGANAVRVRATPLASLSEWQGALTEDVCKSHVSAQAYMQKAGATLKNGKATAHVTNGGKLTITNDKGKVVLEEFVRNRKDPVDPSASALEVDARHFRSLTGSDNFHLTARFESKDENERIFGMGQYQQSILNLKGAELELAQRNSQASVPFATSSLGYGLLWNVPAIGRAFFGTNVMCFEAFSTQKMDYWVVVDDTPADIQHAYAAATGTVPMMPEYGLGFWQCKLRYQTQEELLGVVREHKRRGLPIDLIVIDFFHWPTQGDWRFDPTYWPDPQAMVKELKEHNVELMVSIWPTVDKRSENFEALRDAGHLIRSERGSQTQSEFEGECRFVDFTSPAAQEAAWKIAKKNYFDMGIKVFWLDEAEPEFVRYDYENYRMHLGGAQAVGNYYPQGYSKAFFDGQTRAGQFNVVNLVRCAWAGSQKYGALVWSGDIASSWSSFRNQLSAGLNMGMAGLPWWTTDIGGFHGGDPNDEAFRELLIRWFQWGAFCPVFRLHGDREPRQPQHGNTGGASCCSGAANEVWSYGEAVYEICKKYMFIREAMRDYIRELMRQAHKDGTPIMQTMFYQFPADKNCWALDDQYMFGERFLVGPVLAAKQTHRSIYLPEGSQWKRLHAPTCNKYNVNGVNAVLQGGQTLIVEAPLDDMPVFERVGSMVQRV